MNIWPSVNYRLQVLSKYIRSEFDAFIFVNVFLCVLVAFLRNLGFWEWGEISPPEIAGINTDIGIRTPVEYWFHDVMSPQTFEIVP